MGRGSAIGVRIAALAAIALTLSGCGAGFLFGGGERREAWRDMAERRCLREGEAFRLGDVERARPVRARGACGIPRPLDVGSLGGGRVALEPRAKLACPMVPATDRWLATSVQPAARAFLGSEVVGLDLAGSYVCKRRNGRRSAKISEHSFGNAIDIAAFRLADGRRVTVGEGWNGDLAEGLFLRQVHAGACRHFTTVLGPDADRHHTRHFHLDLARHNKDGTYRYCR